MRPFAKLPICVQATWGGAAVVEGGQRASTSVTLREERFYTSFFALDLLQDIVRGLLIEVQLVLREGWVGARRPPREKAPPCGHHAHRLSAEARLDENGQLIFGLCLPFACPNFLTNLFFGEPIRCCGIPYYKELDTARAK